MRFLPVCNHDCRNIPILLIKIHCCNKQQQQMKVVQLGFNLVLIWVAAVAASAAVDDVGHEMASITTTAVATSPHDRIRGASGGRSLIENDEEEQEQDEICQIEAGYC
jgi:hypothetical protein